MSQRLIWIVTAVQCGLLATASVRAEETTPSLEVLSAQASLTAEGTDETSAEAPPIHLSMEFQGAKLSTVLKAFSKQTGINIIAGDDVADHPITVYFEDVAPLDALDQILAAGQLTYELPAGSNIYVVKPKPKAVTEAALITRVYRLRYARVSESMFARTSAAMNELTPTEATAAVSATSSQSASLGRVGTGIDIILKELLTSRGKLVADPRTNSLVITDAPSNFPKIEAALAALDVKTAQILVDTELIETTLTKLKDLGVEWGTGQEGDMVNFSMGSRSTRFPFGFIGDRMAPGNPTALTTSTLNFASATAVLQALENDGDSKVLARPKVLTLDNESALIRLTSNETVGFKITTDTQGKTQAEPERTTTGIILGVTPQVNDGGYLTMVVAPSVTTTVPTKVSPPAGAGSVRDPKTRGTHVSVRIHSGDTLVVGGLIDRENTHALRKVPILSGIPVVGEAFKNDEVNDLASELIVFVTPRILGDATANQVASATPAAGGAREQEPGSSSRQDLIEQTLNRLEQPSL